MIKQYFLGILSDINYRISIHEGNAKSRLGRYAVEVSARFSKEVISEYYLKDYEKLLKIISDERKLYPYINNTHISFLGKRNTTIVKYIKLLIDIENDLRANISDEENEIIKIE